MNLSSDFLRLNPDDDDLLKATPAANQELTQTGPNFQTCFESGFQVWNQVNDLQVRDNTDGTFNNDLGQRDRDSKILERSQSLLYQRTKDHKSILNNDLEDKSISEDHLKSVNNRSRTVMIIVPRSEDAENGQDHIHKEHKYSFSDNREFEPSFGLNLKNMIEKSGVAKINQSEPANVRFDSEISFKGSYYDLSLIPLGFKPIENVVQTLESLVPSKNSCQIHKAEIKSVCLTERRLICYYCQEDCEEHDHTVNLLSLIRKRALNRVKEIRQETFDCLKHIQVIKDWLRIKKDELTKTLDPQITQCFHEEHHGDHHGGLLPANSAEFITDLQAWMLFGFVGAKEERFKRQNEHRIKALTEGKPDQQFLDIYLEKNEEYPSRNQIQDDLGKYWSDEVTFAWLSKRNRAIVNQLRFFRLFDQSSIIDPTPLSKEAYAKLPRLISVMTERFLHPDQDTTYFSKVEILNCFYTLMSLLDHIHITSPHAYVEILTFTQDEEPYYENNDFGGLMSYLAPEMLSNENIPTDKHISLISADLWSLGLLVLEMCVLKPSLLRLAMTRQHKQQIITKHIEEVRHRYDELIAEMLSKLLDFNPQQRGQAIDTHKAIQKAAKAWDVQQLLGVRNINYQLTHL